MAHGGGERKAGVGAPDAFSSYASQDAAQALFHSPLSNLSTNGR
jgi:hypothetical protein